MRQVLSTGLPETRENVPLMPERGGAVERAYFTVSFSALRDGSGTVAGTLATAIETTERVRAESSLRESEERQAFLLKLSGALRPLADPVEVQSEAARVLGEHLGAGRAAYAEVEADDAHFTVHRDYTDSVPSFAGRYPLDSHGPEFWDDLRAGRTISVVDAERDARISEAERAPYVAGMVRAAVGVPLVKGGRLAAVFFLHFPVPHQWPSHEGALVEETAERIWATVERASAEAALRESEERFSQFVASSSDALWIRDAATLAMEYASPAIATIYGVPSEALLGDVKHWAALVVPDDRDIAFRHLGLAQRGASVVHEFRVQRAADQAFRWVRNTDFPLHDETGRVQRIGGIAQDVTEVKLATEHSAVLLAELQHRVSNIMAMIRSMANRTTPGASGVEDYRSLLEGRLLALARVQALLTRKANAGGSLRTVIESEVTAQAHHGDQFRLTGPDIPLAPKAVEVLTLAFHELATNARKYGALSVPEGRLSVTWTPIEKRGAPWLSLDWIEEGAPPREPSTRRGFGSELIEARIPYELGGRGKIAISAEGARCHLEFPLNDGESILETDAPQPKTVFGGTLDMTGATDLTGRTVLVVEDDYYIAHDTAAALRSAGAAVLGPCPSVHAVQDLLDDEPPTHAVLDLNLGGGGPQFEIAHLLKARGVPFVFLTGYDPNVIPDDMRDITRLQKPLPFRAIVEAVGQL